MDIRVNQRKIHTEKAVGNVKLLSITDIHYRNDKYAERLKRLRELILEISPDVICMAGDIVDFFDEIVDDKQKLYSFLDQISENCPVLMSYGAHDYYSLRSDRNVELCKWFYEMNGISPNLHAFSPGDSSVILLPGNMSACGYSIPIDENLQKENNQELFPLVSRFIGNIELDPTTYNLLSCHSPIPFFYNGKLRNLRLLGFNDIDLISSGHYHAGLAPKFLEFLQLGFITPDKKFFPQNVAGLFNSADGKISIDISRGFLKIPGSIKEELGPLGNIIYEGNSLFKPDVELLTIEGQSKGRVYSIR